MKRFRCLWIVALLLSASMGICEAQVFAPAPIQSSSEIPVAVDEPIGGPSDADVLVDADPGDLANVDVGDELELLSGQFEATLVDSAGADEGESLDIDDTASDEPSAVALAPARYYIAVQNGTGDDPIEIKMTQSDDKGNEVATKTFKVKKRKNDKDFTVLWMDKHPKSAGVGIDIVDPGNKYLTSASIGVENTYTFEEGGKIFRIKLKNQFTYTKK